MLLKSWNKGWGKHVLGSTWQKHPSTLCSERQTLEIQQEEPQFRNLLRLILQLERKWRLCENLPGEADFTGTSLVRGSWSGFCSMTWTGGLIKGWQPLPKDAHTQRVNGNEKVLNILVEAKIESHRRPGNWVCHHWNVCILERDDSIHRWIFPPHVQTSGESTFIDHGIQTTHSNGQTFWWTWNQSFLFSVYLLHSPDFPSLEFTKYCVLGTSFCLG